ncbi:MAG: rhomboid family intramembrane serine protease [Lachnospiraceae bacterium]|nr:rhomboid family intramembrane serine protease [Lachnospiraceae bacterium]
MKIKDVYFGKRFPFVSIAIAVLCLAVTIISQLKPSTYIAFAFTYPVKYPWQVISYVFLHGIAKDLLPPDFPFSPMKLAIGHVGFNLLLILPFGILCEKVLGNVKFLLLSAVAWLTDIGCIFILALSSKDDTFLSAGASGLAFAYMPVGMFIIISLGKKYGFKNLFKQIIFYLLMPIAIFTFIFAVSPNVAGVTGVESMIVHLLALCVGVLMAVLFRKKIKGYFESVN